MLFRRYIILFVLILVVSTYIQAEEYDNSTKKERNFIRQGNEEYNSKNYSEAETYYKKALELNLSSDIAKFNLASSYMKQSGDKSAGSIDNLINSADTIFNSLTNSQNKFVAEQSFYNIGNIEFDRNNFAKSIEMYKKALRINPDNDKARENLRLAQLKLQEQQNQNKNNQQDKNNKKEEEQNKQDQQNKQNEQNKEQNQDKKDQDKKDENKDEQQKQSGNSDKKEQNPPQSQGISDANAEKILKTMENEENATRKKVNAKKKAEQQNSSRRQIINQW